VPREWRAVRPLVRSVLLLPLLAGPQFGLFALERRIDNVGLATFAFFGGGVTLFSAGWWLRRRVSKLAGTVLMLGAGTHVLGWSLLSAYVLFLT
jgi:hypothetical protein